MTIVTIRLPSTEGRTGRPEQLIRRDSERRGFIIVRVQASAHYTAGRFV
jgi:hypothetical protein